MFLAVLNLIFNLFILSAIIVSVSVISVQNFILETWLALVRSNFALFHNFTLPRCN